MSTIDQEVGVGLAYLHARERSRMNHRAAREWAREHWAEFLAELDSPTGKLLLRMAQCAREADKTRSRSFPEPLGPEIAAIRARIRPLETQWLNPPMRNALLAGAAADPTKIGSALARYREQAGLTVEQQAEQLGIDLDGLALVAVSRMPRRRHWKRNLEQVCRRWGANPDVLAVMLLPERLGSP